MILLVVEVFTEHADVLKLPMWNILNIIERPIAADDSYLFSFVLEKMVNTSTINLIDKFARIRVRVMKEDCM